MNEPNSAPTSSTWESAIGIVVVLMLLFSLALIAAGGWNWFKTLLESAAPAWIQAIGSVAAIIAATVIARRQSISTAELAEKKQAAADVQKLKIVMALMARAYGLSKDICHAFETSKFEDFDQVSPELLLDTHQALKALPVFDIPDGLLALDVLTIGRALGDLREHWLKLREDCERDPSSLQIGIATLDSLAREIGEVSLAALSECKKAIAQRGGAIGIQNANE